MSKPLNFLISDNPRVPKSPYPFRHVTDVQTRFSDIDILGHLNNNAYFSLFDLAKIKYLQATAPERYKHDLQVKAVVVHIDCDFYSPAYFGEPLQVWTTIGHCSHNSFTIEQRMVNAQTSQTKCISHTVMAGFDPKARQGMPIDPEWIAAAEAWEERPLLTHDTDAPCE